MEEKKIVINIDDKGNMNAETFGITGTECLVELDKLMKDLALSTTTVKKQEFFDQGISASSKVINKRD